MTRSHKLGNRPRDTLANRREAFEGCNIFGEGGDCLAVAPHRLGSTAVRPHAEKIGRLRLEEVGDTFQHLSDFVIRWF